MLGFRHILFPVDFSERCAAVRPFVRHLANKSGAKVTLLHSFEAARSLCGASDGAFTTVFDVSQMQEESCSLLAEFFPAEPGDNFQIVYDAACGDTAHAIVDFARANTVDLIMIPSHGHGKFHRLFLGSLTSTILENAPCAVWTAAHTEDPALPSHAKCRTIVLALNAEPEEARTVRRASEVCQAFSEKLFLLHGVKDSKEEQIARWKIDDLQREAQTNLEVVIQPGNPVDAVARFARERNADLLIVGPGALRSQAQEIIRNARVPVLSL
jgi:nucleotide-binding universal stress UspA family protein